MAMRTKGSIRYTLISIAEEVTGNSYKGSNGANEPRDTDWLSELGMDSMEIAYLIQKAEKEFNVKIPDQERKRLVTFGYVVDSFFEKVRESESAAGQHPTSAVDASTHFEKDPPKNYRSV